MQFRVLDFRGRAGRYLMGGANIANQNPPLMDRIYFKLKSENLEWHPDGCNFTLRKRSLSILIFVTLLLAGCFFTLLPPLNFLEAKSPRFFFFILNELHPAAENFTFLTKTNYIPYENTLHSLLECTCFSAGMLLILVRNVKFSRLETIIFLA